MTRTTRSTGGEAETFSGSGSSSFSEADILGVRIVLFSDLGKHLAQQKRNGVLGLSSLARMPACFGRAGSGFPAKHKNAKHKKTQKIKLEAQVFNHITSHIVFTHGNSKHTTVTKLWYNDSEARPALLLLLAGDSAHANPENCTANG